MIRDTPADAAEQIARDVVAEVGPHVGAAGAEAQLLRVGASVLVALPAASVLLRIEPSEREGSVRRQVVIGRLLERAGVPAARLVAPDLQPFRVARWCVTAWELLDPVAGAAVDPAELGALASTLHRATAALAATEDLPLFDPFAAIRAQIDTAAAVAGADDPDVALLRVVTRETASAWDATPHDPLGVAVVHGDLHAENVVVTADGARLVDLELAGVGPPTYDLAAQLVAVERYGAPVERYERFSAAYAFDLRTWEGAAVRTRTYALWTTAWAVGHRHLSAAHAAEADRRVAYWRDPGAAVRWTLR